MTTTSLSTFDALIQRHSLLTHYLYQQKWNKGELTLEDLRNYAKEYFHFVKAVPGVVSSVKERALERNPEMVPFVEQNLEEETEHIELWRRFAHSLDLTDADLDTHVPQQKTVDAVAEIQSLAEGSLEEGAAVMYALELDLPQIAETKKDGLCKYYGLTSEDAHIYFNEHLGEEKHLAVWRQIQVDPVKVQPVIEKALALQHVVLDGVCDLCGMPCTCEEAMT